MAHCYDFVIFAYPNLNAAGFRVILDCAKFINPAQEILCVCGKVTPTTFNTMLFLGGDSFKGNADK